MFSIKRIFTFASHIPGNEVLRLILWIQVIISFVIITKTIVFGKEVKEPFTTDLPWCIPLLIFNLASAILPVYILWKGIKFSSKALLGWFIIIKLIFVLAHIALKPLLKYYGPIVHLNLLSISNFTRIFKYILDPPIFLLSFYSIYVVYVYYKKLESPIMTQLRYQCHLLKETECEGSTEIIPENDAHKPCCNSNKLKSFILNPFDVTIDTKNVLGEGQFGTVYKGNFRLKDKKNLIIAAKVAKNVASSETLEMLFQEIKILISVGDHQNIIKFYGVTSDGSLDNHLAIISEYVSYGCLEIFLQENRHTFKDFIRNSDTGVHSDKPNVYINLEEHGTHSTDDLIKLSADIARGMEHLASKKIVHGDLACRNVLVTGDLTAKLTDFGMSRRLYAYQVYSTFQQQKCLLPWRWMSIEAIEDLNLSEKSDVWSYGVTLWEIFTLGEFPFEKLEWSLDIPRQIRQGLLKLSKPKYSNHKIFNIMNECWNIDPSERPTFHDLQIKFEIIIEENNLQLQELIKN